MIKALLFDFGGVLGSNADTLFYETLENRGIIRVEAEHLWEEHWPNLKLGRSGVDEIWKGVKAAYGGRISIEEVRKEYDAHISVDQEALDLAKSLGQREFRLAILANEAKEWMQLKREKGDLDSIFEKVYGSADIGLAKPDKRAYEFVLREMGLHGEEVVFIDNLERNLPPAMELGMRCIFFRGLPYLKEDLVHILG